MDINTDKARDMDINMNTKLTKFNDLNFTIVSVSPYAYDIPWLKFSMASCTYSATYLMRAMHKDFKNAFHQTMCW